MAWLNFAVLGWTLWFIVSPAASCTDSGWFCWWYKTTNKCALSSNYAVNKCMKTCNFCPVSTDSPVTTDESSSPITTLPTAPSKPKCFAQSLNFPVSREQFMDKRLEGHVMWHQSVISEVQCEDLCLRVPGCLAYNYYYLGAIGQKWCELMNEVTVVKDSPGISFRLFERERVLKVLLGSCLGET